MYCEFKILLTDNTTGTLDRTDGSTPQEGETVTVKSHDENGNPIEVIGCVHEVLDYNVYTD